MPPIIIPVKRLHAAKSRLAAVLDAQGRAALVVWMVERVLAAAASEGPVYVR